MKSQIQHGAWIIAAYKVISKFNLEEPVFDPLEATINAGRSGEFFSAIRSLKKINNEKFELFRKINKLRSSVMINILKIAEDLGSVEVTWNTTSESDRVESIKLINNSKDDVYKLTSKLFNRLNPSNIESAILNVLSYTLLIPRSVKETEDKLSKTRLTEKDVSDAITLAINLGLLSQTDETEQGQKILYNSHAFESNAIDAFNAIDELNDENKQKAIELLNFIEQNPGVPLKKTFDINIVNLLIKVGLIDYSKITTTASKIQRYFATAPHIWGVIAESSGSELSDDLIDDAKLLLNSFRYGQYFSTSDKGRIKDPSWIVNALIRDGAIGTGRPATAIGTDYPLALSRGIVNIVESRIYPGRYSMELKKFDVAEAVKDVLDKNTIIPMKETPTAKDLERAGQLFTSPNTVRTEIELPKELKICQEEMIFGLRTMRKGR